MNWIGLLRDLGITATISTIIPLLLTRFLNKKDKRNNDIEDLKKFKENHEVLTKEILNVLENLKRDMKIYNDSQQALLRDKMIQMYNHYMERGGMPIYARESLDKMYQQYHKLGGNGAIEPLVEKLYSLPTKAQREDEEI
jgi:hypothetical protein